MKKSQELICILCPLGCTLDVRVKNGEVRSVAGNRCRRGVRYATDEVRDPRRTVTTTVRLRSGTITLLPVKTREPVPRDLAQAVVAAASRVTVEAPVLLGNVVLADACATGVDLVATRSAAREDDP
jgi:CxxC motif-containing protein